MDGNRIVRNEKDLLGGKRKGIVYINVATI